MMQVWRRRRPPATDRLIRLPERESGPAVELVDPAEQRADQVVVKERDELRATVEAALDALGRSPLYGGQRPGDLVAAVQTLLTGFRNLTESQEQAAVELARERRRNEDLNLENAQLANQVAALRNHTSSDEARRWKRMWEQDRRNLAVLEDRLAAAEGRRTSSTSYSGGVFA
jgi:hypothetical protein